MTISSLDDLVRRVESYDEDLAHDVAEYIRRHRYGLVYEESRPGYVRMWGKPIVPGDDVNVLPARGTPMKRNGGAPCWHVNTVSAGRAKLFNPLTDEHEAVDTSDLVAVAGPERPIYAGLGETGRVERGGDKPYHVIINGENYHALQLLLYAYEGKIDCIYIDPPYNTGAKDWKYDNNYSGSDDEYKHSRWLTFMEDRLMLAKRLLNPGDSVLIVTIDEKEYLRLGLLLEQMFPEARIQMVTTVINPSGNSRGDSTAGFSRVNEYIYFVILGDAKVRPWIDSMLPIIDENGKVKKSVRTVGGLKWENFLRSGKGNNRSSEPNLFYPIYVDKNTMSIIGAGEPCSDSISSLPHEFNGFSVAWPLRQDGDSAIWHLKKSSLLKRLEKGYVYVSSYNKKRGTYTIQYLPSGTIKEIESGRVSVERTGNRGQVIAMTDAMLTQLPKNVWNMRSHNAGMSGSDLLSRILPRREFPYPKSLYAVEDCLRFFVADKPNALILDFFAGSGTTAHATMRLNHQDGGRRRSISVTNNEVSNREAIDLASCGLRQGDQEWESNGICKYVTEPRVKAVITGETPDGDPIKGKYKFTDEFPMADGFKENAVFFDLEYLEPSVTEKNIAYEKVAPILWMAGGCEGPVLHYDDGYTVGETYAVLFDTRMRYEFVDAVSQHEGIRTAFVVTDSEDEYRSVCESLPTLQIRRIREDILKGFELTATA